MRKPICLPVVLIALSIISANLKAQSTFSKVHELLQTNCAGTGCHVSGGDPSFNVSVSESDLYAQLVNAPVLNQAAAAKFNKLVVPGDVHRSFFLRKLANSISDGLALTYPDEGEDMPAGSPMADYEIELVRQWILFGAPLTGEVVDTALINTYYRSGGVDETYPYHEPPDPSEGFQIYVGKLFLPPHTEREYFLKFDPHLTSAVEGIRVVTMMPNYMHHFVLYSFSYGGDALYRHGLRPLSENSMESVYNAIGTASGLWDYSLPQGTAYFFDEGIMFDVNAHCINTSSSIVASDLYINVYTEPIGTADNYMFIRNFVDETISIPMDSQFYTFSQAAFDNNETKSWKLWKLYTHTHKYGKKFDIFLRNADGTKGEKIYDGNYSYEDGFDTGYYRWGIDVTFRTWPDNDLFEVDPRLGFIYEATYQNTGGPDPVNWGMTSTDEMMAMGFHFIYGPELSTGVKRIEKNGLSMNILPNPSRNEFTLSYKIEQTQPLRVEIFDLLGEKIATLINDTPQAGIHTQNFYTADYGLKTGIYFLTILIGDKTFAEKLIVTN